jgi:hypothetical protein
MVDETAMWKEVGQKPLPLSVTLSLKLMVATKSLSCVLDTKCDGCHNSDPGLRVLRLLVSLNGLRSPERNL